MTFIFCVANNRRTSRFLPSVSSIRTMPRARVLLTKVALRARNNSPASSTPSVKFSSAVCGTSRGVCVARRTVHQAATPWPSRVVAVDGGKVLREAC